MDVVSCFPAHDARDGRLFLEEGRYLAGGGQDAARKGQQAAGNACKVSMSFHILVDFRRTRLKL